ncbi:MAG TPA: holo-ACP synthase [Capsulimonadaceae bacterium]|jgi:holo-[acyl-carrier protein] synthase
MAIIGIGTDLVEASRFRADLVSEKLLLRVFTPAEREYCSTQRFPELHLAARFAAKEATVKALSSLYPKLVVSQIEVVRLPSGAGEIHLVRGAASQPPPLLDADIRLHVSLSHAGWYATATVVAERVDS